MIKRYGEDRIMHMVDVLENRNKWQRERYAKVNKRAGRRSKEAVSASESASSG
jgi:hypothetical protein